jgi:hypothetical protein
VQIFYNCLINIKGLRRNDTLSAAIDTLDELVDVIGGGASASADGEEKYPSQREEGGGSDPRVGAFKTAAALVLKELQALPPIVD